MYFLWVDPSDRQDIVNKLDQLLKLVCSRSSPESYYAANINISHSFHQRGPFTTITWQIHRDFFVRYNPGVSFLLLNSLFGQKYSFWQD